MTTTTLSVTSHDAIRRNRFFNLAVSMISSFFKASPAAPLHAADAQAVRKLAFSYAKSDPGFASDLYAAADRHELEMDSLAV